MEKVTIPAIEYENLTKSQRTLESLMRVLLQCSAVTEDESVHEFCMLETRTVFVSNLQPKTIATCSIGYENPRQEPLLVGRYDWVENKKYKPRPIYL
jgi:hypothetical protein